jgi:hypothetical protein
LKGFSIFKYVISVAVLIGITSRSSAQTFLGLKAGANATRISFDNEVYKDFYDTNFKPGFTVGGVFLMENKEKYGLNVEFLYSVKGKSVDSYANDYLSNRANYHYLDFPILFRMKFNESKLRWFLQLGPEVSYWLSGNGEFEVYEPDRDVITKYKYTINFGELKSSSDYLNMPEGSNRLQLGLAIGGGCSWKLDRGNYLLLDVRYTFGHTFMGPYEGSSIPNIGLVDNMEHTNNVASVSLVYYFDILEKLRLSKNKYHRN